MFLSPLFREAFVNTLNVPLQLYETNGAIGAALGAGVGSGVYSNPQEAFNGLELTGQQEPEQKLAEQYVSSYQSWIKSLRA